MKVQPMNLIIILAIVVLHGWIFSHNALATSTSPNIVVVLVDDMGYGDPACFNPNSKIATPHLDAIAKSGMRFTDAHAPGPLCHMSRYGLMTGQYPFRTDVSVWPTQPLIVDDQMTIASLAQDQGYHTAMIGKWHLGFREEGYDRALRGGPIDRGFDSFYGIRASTDIPPYFYIRGDRAVEPPTEKILANRTDGWSPIQGAFWREGGIAPNLDLADVLERFTDEATQVITQHAARQANKTAEQNAKQPLMMYLAYPAPHTPWLPSAEFVGKSGAGMYGDFVMMVDAQIGRISQSLRDAGMEENTLLIVTSDNGPVWYDEDRTRFQHDAAGGWRGMKADAWEAGHRMPMIAKWPGRVARGSRSKQLVCFTDFLATFADIFEVTLPDDAGPDSFSFLPALLGNDTPTVTSRQELVMQAGGVRNMMVIRQGKWKLINQLGSGGFSKPKLLPPTADGVTGQLYDLESDPAEIENLFAKHPEVVLRLQSTLNEISRRKRSRLPPPTPSRNPSSN
ncbi:Arylsulfatase [Allorhodopirellula heiligendammensis]|uniref:Arylsulfatase n=2 Tax=Allorhodopirellula heiligendammensis TaxID=2714739 RepID=A0A5C6C5N1_9BACT|nr:Arylsulfatase [Allorhodopirellula heiligendammensis]